MSDFSLRDTARSPPATLNGPSSSWTTPAPRPRARSYPPAKELLLDAAEHCASVDASPSDLAALPGPRPAGQADRTRPPKP